MKPKHAVQNASPALGESLRYCPRCRSTVRMAWTRAPLHDGHANIPDPELVCLDVGARCSRGVCAVTGLPEVAMRKRRRLAE